MRGKCGESPRSLQMRTHLVQGVFEVYGHNDRSNFHLGQVFRIGTVDVLRACDACADMRTAYSV